MPEDYTQQIERFLNGFCKHKISESERIGQNYAELWQEIDEYIRGGGKRLRPRVFMMIYGFYGGTDAASALQAACAWELLHASLLIHDDIIDRDTLRHGKLNIAGKYREKYAPLTNTDAEHYALSAALLAGDLLLSSAFDVVNTSNLNDKQKLAMQQFLYKAIFVVGGGELIDTESALYPIDSVDPYAVATYKTASYSFMLPMQAGAALADAASIEIEKLGEIGRCAGIAFQLQDDLLGVFGDGQTTGKSTRSDITEKKRTLLIQHTVKNAATERAERLKELYAQPTALTDEQAEEVYDIINSTSAKNEIETLIESHSKAALDIVQILAVDDVSRQTLSALISSLVGRKA